MGWASGKIPLLDQSMDSTLESYPAGDVIYVAAKRRATFNGLAKPRSKLNPCISTSGKAKRWLKIPRSTILGPSGRRSAREIYLVANDFLKLQ